MISTGLPFRLEVMQITDEDTEWRVEWLLETSIYSTFSFMFFHHARSPHDTNTAFELLRLCSSIHFACTILCVCTETKRRRVTVCPSCTTQCNSFREVHLRIAHLRMGFVREPFFSSCRFLWNTFACVSCSRTLSACVESWIHWQASNRVASGKNPNRFNDLFDEMEVKKTHQIHPHIYQTRIVDQFSCEPTWPGRLLDSLFYLSTAFFSLFSLFSFRFRLECFRLDISRRNKWSDKSSVGATWFHWNIPCGGSPSVRLRFRKAPMSQVT